MEFDPIIVNAQSVNETSEMMTFGERVHRVNQHNEDNANGEFDTDSPLFYVMSPDEMRVVGQALANSEALNTVRKLYKTQVAELINAGIENEPESEVQESIRKTVNIMEQWLFGMDEAGNVKMNFPYPDLYQAE